MRGMVYAALAASKIGPANRGRRTCQTLTTGHPIDRLPAITPLLFRNPTAGEGTLIRIPPRYCFRFIPEDSNVRSVP
jgi:hypothetical protein